MTEFVDSPGVNRFLTSLGLAGLFVVVYSLLVPLIGRAAPCLSWYDGGYGIGRVKPGDRVESHGHVLPELRKFFWSPTGPRGDGNVSLPAPSLVGVSAVNSSFVCSGSLKGSSCGLRRPRVGKSEKIEIETCCWRYRALVSSAIVFQGRLAMLTRSSLHIFPLACDRDDPSSSTPSSTVVSLLGELRCEHEEEGNSTADEGAPQGR